MVTVILNTSLTLQPIFTFEKFLFSQRQATQNSRFDCPGYKCDPDCRKAYTFYEHEPSKYKGRFFGEVLQYSNPAFF